MSPPTPATAGGARASGANAGGASGASGATGTSASTAGETPYRIAAEVPDGHLLAQAVARHVHAVAATTRLDTDTLRAATSAWDTALGDRATRGYADQRALATGAASGDAALARVSREAQDELATAALAAGVAFLADGRDGETGRAVAAAMRERLLVDVERAATALENRVRADRDHPPLDEWREWNHLRGLVERAGRLGGLPLRRLVFAQVHDAGCPLAVRLWNHDNQRPLANAIFTWLAREAEAVGNEGLAKHERKNVSAGI